MEDKKSIIPTLEELQKIFFPDGIEDEKNKSKVYIVPKEEVEEILCIMKSTFKCKNCGNCCKECAKHGIAVRDEDYNRICSYLKISHGEFKRRYKHKFKRDYVLLQGEEGCPFYNEEEKKCSIYEVKPGICSQYPFTGANLKIVEGGVSFIPCTFCYPYLLGLYLLFENAPIKEEIKKKIDSLPEDIRKGLFEEMEILRKEKMKDGLNKLKKDDV